MITWQPNAIDRRTLENRAVVNQRTWHGLPGARGCGRPSERGRWGTETVSSLPSRVFTHKGWFSAPAVGFSQESLVGLVQRRWSVSRDHSQAPAENYPLSGFFGAPSVSTQPS